MNRINRLLEKQLDKPRTYEQLKHNPFPYLQETSRTQIFQFIHNMEAQNKDLKIKIAQKYPQKSLEEIIRSHQRIQLKKQLIKLNKQSIQRMEIQLSAKRSQWETLQTQNRELAARAIRLEKDTVEAELRLIEVEQQKRDLELQEKLRKQRENSLDASKILKDLYHDVKDILQSSI